MSPAPCLMDAESGEVLLGKLEIADTYWKRLCGLQGRPPLPLDCGLILVPGGSVHTFFMRFSMDLIGLNREGCVVGIRRSIKPWRLARAWPQTVAVIEVTSGAMMSLQVGRRVCIRSSATEDSGPLPRTVQFLAQTP